ncbi:methyltransferase domain-containing protein [Paenibacillus lignilyticus]|uniref:Class I SAM-dependent methyltransferase n=1 Tax=Paenibacillus lignilyticus TaxID=1172615 RepID=A0ABS5CDR6_9BACL|nr:class I SAM-dependent methyltransferase [Paenibacillus lignilyticus]MBP3964127.1 class I SAM-dependent methyltransferase [Paenibacillus lignilyticus]
MKLDIGCGANKLPDCYGIDRYALPGVNLVSDLDTEIPFPDNSIDFIAVSRMLPYVSDLNFALREIYRVSVHKTVVCLLCPYAHNFRHSSNPFLKHRFDEHTPRYMTASFKQPPGSPICPPLSPYSYVTPPPYDFRLLRMELFYQAPYLTDLYEPDELEVLKELQANVVDEILYYYVVAKAPITDEEWLAMCNEVHPEPHAVTMLRSIAP